MLKVVIADDENKVCQLIQTLGEWDRLGLELAAVCHDGQEAMDAIRLHRPDIVLTDIRMPVYDGIQLIEKARQEGIDSVFVIISGYRQFEYAHSAMQYGVADYLLKPIDREQLNSVLEKTCRQIREQHEAKNSEEQAQRIIAQNKERLRDGLLRDLLEDPAVGNLDPGQIARRYEVHFEPGGYQALLLNTGVAGLHRGNALFGEKVRDAAVRVFAGSFELLCTPTHRGVWCLINHAPERQSNMKNLIQAFYYDVKAMEDIYGSFRLVIGVGDAVERFADVRRAMEEASLAESAKWLLGAPQVVFSITLPAQEAGELVEPDMLGQLDAALETLREEGCRELFGRLRGELPRWGLERAAALVRLRDEVCGRYARWMELAGVDGAEELLEDLRQRTHCAADGRAVMDLLESFAREQIAGRLEEQSSRESRPVRLARQMIDSGYRQPLTLEAVAAEVGFSPAYFSGVFKKHVGRSFTDYLIQVRVEAAKELLRGTDKTVNEISEEVGYCDSKHFRKLFKKMVGTKPTEFRRLYR